MRHNVKSRRLGRTTSHRQAMFRNMATDFLRHEKIKTTLPKAKELRRVVEKLITKSKKVTLSDLEAAPEGQRPELVARATFALRITHAIFRKATPPLPSFVDLTLLQRALEGAFHPRPPSLPPAPHLFGVIIPPGASRLPTKALGLEPHINLVAYSLMVAPWDVVLLTIPHNNSR